MRRLFKYIILVLIIIILVFFTIIYLNWEAIINYLYGISYLFFLSLTLEDKEDTDFGKKKKRRETWDLVFKLIKDEIKKWLKKQLGIK